MDLPGRVRSPADGDVIPRYLLAEAAVFLVSSLFSIACDVLNGWTRV